MKTLTILKELKEAPTGLYTDKEIRGCTELSLTWQHEFRHFEQFSKGISSKLHELSYILFYAFGSLLFALSILYKDISLKTVLPAIGLLVIPHLSLMIYFEAEAWTFAVIRRFKEYDPRIKYNENEIPVTINEGKASISAKIFSIISALMILGILIMAIILK